jgi:glycosyltransferase involved in cell wall biosynthesis
MDNTNRKKFAAFIMTYERPEILLQTVSILQSQSFPPEKILIVDNSESDATKIAIQNLQQSDLEYFKVGYNSGPAGAAKIGLQKLTAEGYQWIYWGDDDDPPKFSDSFERLLGLAHKYKHLNIGILGMVGQHFNSTIGTIQRVKDKELREKDLVTVESIAGGQTMIVNSAVVRSGVLPDENLYFGFEELDFCLRTKQAGFELVVSTELFLRAREKYGRLNYRPPFYIQNKKGNWNRNYYSTRNILFILKRNRLYMALGYHFFKNLFKMIYAFRFGFKYGKSNLYMTSLGFYHGIINRAGKIFS